MTQVRNEDSPTYAEPTLNRDLIDRAIQNLRAFARKPGAVMSSPQVPKDLCQLEMAGLEHEVFCVLFLDAQHRLVTLERMFTGTLTQASVYPREVVKRALQLNAAAVILAHNHPSGMVEPSRADEHLTQSLKAALNLIDVRILDHIIVSNEGTTSLAERGLI